MVRPTPELLKRVIQRYDWTEITEDMSNSIGEVNHADLIYTKPMNAIRLHPHTGNVPFWHPLFAGCTAAVGDLRTEQQRLARVLGEG
jgi:hypothetical protein